MIKIETQDFVHGVHTIASDSTSDAKQWQVGDFGGRQGVYMSNVGKGQSGTVAFEARKAVATAGEALVIGDIVYYDKDNFKLYKTDKGSGGTKGASHVGYSLSTVSVDDECIFRFTQKHS